MKPIAAVLLVVAAGYPVALVLTRRVLFAALIAPLITAVTASLAVITMLITRGDLRVWLTILLLAQFAFVAWQRGRRSAPIRHATWADTLCFALPLVPPGLQVFAPPVQWDANSIWWTHAAYFVQGGAFARHDMTSLAYFNSHPDYPPLNSATVAAVWSVVPGSSLVVAQVVSTTLTLSAIGTLGYAVRSVTARAPTAISRLAGVAVALAAWGTAWTVAAAGYSDQLWAAPLVAAAALLLLGERPIARPAVPALLLTVAALSKNEALLPVLLVAVLLAVRERRGLLRTWPVWPALVAGIGWLLLARAIGAEADVTSDGALAGMRRLLDDPSVRERVPPTLHSLWQTVGPLVAVSLVAVLLGWAALRRGRRDLGIAPDGPIWAIVVIYTGSLLFIYTTSRQILQWYLATSMNRVTVPIELFACLTAVCWATVAATQLRREPGTPLSAPARR